jgi:acyl transferase domain-containing protein/NADPH:quinone reductase-like Zn-dependent oxidoreductase/acyl carrier protein
MEIDDGVIPIAITGIGCRFPGAHGPASFWTLLCSDGDAIGEVPRDRFDTDLHYDATPATPGKTVSRWGGFLDDIDAFDAAFFGISPREAAPMDPQQRLLLEVSWEALEDAGEGSVTLAGSRTGVFIGQTGSDYWDMQSGGSDYEIYDMTGSASRATIPGRIAFAFDLRGPTVAVDSTCSTSLVAVHLACESLRSGESTLALVGASNVILSPAGAIMLSQGQVLSPDGRCKFADERADGFVRSEGVAIVVLKRLPDALANDDRIYALILGSAINNDGRGSGQLMTPAGSGQRDLLRLAYRKAGVDPASADILEAHGTGTAVGDPIELSAAADVLGTGRSPDTPCLVGSVKTNIGHTEATAGMAGLIKAALSLQHRCVPATLHHHNPTSAIDWKTTPLVVPRELTPLPDRGRPAIAGVSSFGISGANAHVVLGEARTPVTTQQPEEDARPCLLPLSACVPAALHDLAGRYVAYLAPSGPGGAHGLRDICHSAATRRTHFDRRLAVVGATHDEIAQRLEDFLAGAECRELSAGHDLVGPRPRIAFVFPGQGSQWVGMGRELLATCPPFADAMRECDAAVRHETGWSVIAELTAQDPSRRTGLDVLQPTLWAMEVALAQLWRTWGIEPRVVIGHSMGEIAAACVAGALSYADAAAVICRRSKLASKRSGQGAMAVVELPAEAVVPMLDAHAGRVSVAACNSPAATVLSGAPADIDEILSTMERSGVVGRKIDVDFASHSPQMDELLGELEEGLTELRPRAGAIPIHSAVQDARVDGAGFDGAYWARNLRDPVLFSAAIRKVAQESETIFLEISPHPILTADIEECLRTFGVAGTAYGSLRRTESEWTSLLTTLGALYTQGHEPIWEQVNGRAAYVRVPGYPWQHERFWVGDGRRVESADARSDANRHPLLGAQVAADAEAGRYVWAGPIDRARNAYLDDHRVQGAIVLPSAAYIELATAAARVAFGDGPVAAVGIAYQRALSLRDDMSPELRVALTRGAEGIWDLKICSRYGADDPWLSHVTCTLRPAVVETARVREPVETIRDRCDVHITRTAFYDRFGDSGNEWKERFRTIAEIWRRDGEALARICCADSADLELGGFHSHPALFDGCMQAFAAAMSGELTAAGDDAFVLVGTDEARILRPLDDDFWSHVRIRAIQDSSITGDISVFDRRGDPIAELLGVHFQHLGGGIGAQAGQSDRPSDRFRGWCYVPRWRPVSRTRREPPFGGAWLVFTDSTGKGEALLRRLEATGQTCVSVTAGWSYVKLGRRRYQANPGSSLDMGRVIRDGLSEIGASAWWGVVNLWDLEAGTGDIAAACVLGCDSVARLVRALTAEQVSPRLWLITQGAQAVASGESANPAQAAVWGLGRVIATEHPELCCTLIDLDPLSTDCTEIAAFLWEELCSGTAENQLAMRDDELFALRLAPYELGRREAGAATAADAEGAAGSVETTWRVRTPAAGPISGLALEPAERTAPGPGEVEIEVAYAALDDAAASPAMKTTPAPAAASRVSGWEWAGRVRRLGDGLTGLDVGDEVIACADGTLARHVIAKAALVFRKPTGLTLEEAATLPVAFLTAYHALRNLARLRPDDRVLIHSATCGVGLAAIQIARSRGAEIFATADSAERREVLGTLEVRHIGDCLSQAFVADIRSATGGRGVDVILNTLPGSGIEENIALLAPYGRYVELSQSAAVQQEIGIKSAGNLTLSIVDIAHMIREEPTWAGAVLREVLGLVETAALGPLPYQTFPAEQAADAFTHMARARSAGKTLLSFDDVRAPSADAAGSRSAAKATIRSDATYLITGGLGGIGRVMARWLVQRGARHLLLIGRSASPAGNAAPASASAPASSSAAESAAADAIDALRELEQAGARVAYEAADVADESALRAALARYQSAGGPEIRGVIHAAGVVRLTPVSELAAGDFGEVLDPKTKGAWALHQALSDAELDFFVLFSSASSLLGSPLMGGYAAGNAFLDALAQHLRGHRVPAMCVNWGVWSSVGMAARLERDHGRCLVPEGVREITPEDGVKIFDALLAEDIAQIMVMPTDWERWRAVHPEAVSAPLLRELLPGRRSRPPASGPFISASGDAPAIAGPASATPHKEPRPTVSTGSAGAVDQPQPIADYLREQVAKVTGIPMEKLNYQLPLTRQGLDSLMAAEVINRIRERTGVSLPPMTLLGERALAEIAEHVATQVSATTS